MTDFSSHYASRTAIEGSVTSSQSFRPRSLPPYLKSVSPIALDENGYRDVGNKVVRKPWLPDHQAQGCMHPGCPTIFSITERRHHCRCCGKIFCSTHTGYQSLIDSDTSVDRVCNLCFFEQEHLFSTQKPREWFVFATPTPILLNLISSSLDFWWSIRPIGAFAIKGPFW